MKIKNFLTDFYKSIAGFNHYSELIERKMSKAIVYLLFITIIFTLLSFIPTIIISNNGIDGIKENIPSFTIQNYTLSTKVDMTRELYAIEDEILIVLDSTGNLTESNLSEYETGIIFSNKAIHLKNVVQEYTFTYEKLGIEDYNNEKLSKTLDLSKIFIYPILLIATIFIFAFRLFGAYFLYLLTRTFSIGMKMIVPYKKLFVLSCYALTVPTIFAFIIRMFNINVLYYNMIFILLGLLYTWNALIKIKKMPKIEKDEILK